MASVSNKPWSNFKDSDYTDEQFKRAALLPGEGKSDSKFPVLEPDGTLNKQAVFAAASRFNQASLSSEDKAKLKRKLRSLYSQIGEDPPDNLKDSETSYQTPYDETEAVELGSTLMRKQVLPLRSINYNGSTLSFDRDTVKKIADSFTRRPFEYVPFHISGSHTDDPSRSGGEIIGLEATDDGLDALVQLNDAGKEAIERNDYRLPVSVRYHENYVRESDGQSFGPTIEHAAATYKPRMNGMGPWQPVDASEDDEVVDLTQEFYEAPPATEPETEGGLSEEDEALIREIEDELENEADNGEADADDDDGEPDDEEEAEMADTQTPNKGDSVTFKRGSETHTGQFVRMDGDNAVVEVDGEEVKVPSGMLKRKGGSSGNSGGSGGSADASELSEYRSKIADLEAQVKRHAESDRRNTLELRRQKVERELEDYGRAGVPAADLDAARPLLMDDEASGELTYTDLSEEGATEKKSARADLVRRMLDSRKGTIEMGEKGDASAELSEDDARVAKAQAYAKEHNVPFAEAARYVT